MNSYWLSDDGGRTHKRPSEAPIPFKFQREREVNDLIGDSGGLRYHQCGTWWCVPIILALERLEGKGESSEAVFARYEQDPGLHLNIMHRKTPNLNHRKVLCGSSSDLAGADCRMFSPQMHF